MRFNKFSIGAIPFIYEAYCKCGKELRQVSNGFLSSALFCSKCESVYELKMVQVPAKKLTERFLEQARRESAAEKAGRTP